MNIRATIVITTRNRKSDLRVALRSAFAQEVPVEVIVTDDASGDGTVAMVREEFPQVRILRTESCIGCVAQRNRAAEAATTPIIFSIDDDAEFTSPHTLKQTLEEFDDERVCAVAIPFIEPRKDTRVLQRAPVAQGVWITDSYIGTAHAVRRDAFLGLGGYRSLLVHQGEEADFCLRLLAAGKVVRLGGADPIHHYESPKRDVSRMDFYGTRNAILFAWQNVPLPFLFPHLIATTLRCFFWSLDPKRMRVRAKGIVNGFAQMGRVPRMPVSIRVYRAHRWLKKRGPHSLATVEGRLGGARPVQATSELK